MALIQLRCPSCQSPMRAEQVPSPTAVRCPSCSSRLLVPGTATDGEVWFYSTGDRRKLGPVSFARLQALVASGDLQPTHMVLEQGQQKWAPARSVPGLFPAVADATRTDAESEPRRPSAPAGEERRIGRSFRQGVGWLLLQGREVVAATFSRTACLLRFALARWRAPSPRRRDLEARHALGRRLYESGLGDAQTRAEIAAVDGQASGSSTKEKRVREADRTSLLLRLADHSLAAEPQDPARAEHAAALAARAELSRHEEELGRRRAALASDGVAGWLRAGAGYAALGCVMFLTSVLLIGALPRGAPSQRLAADPPAADEEGEARDREIAPPPDRPKHRTQVTDLKEAIRRAGYLLPLEQSAVQGYVRFGPAAAAGKAQADQFARLQAEKEAAAHREAVAGKVFCLTALPVVVPDRDDFATKGLFVVIQVPLRLHVRTRRAGDERSDNVRQLHPCWADAYEPWFLTKTNTLLPCRDLGEAGEVAARGGILYFPDAGETQLILNLAVPLEVATRIGRRPEDFAVDVVLDNVRLLPTVGCGYYRKDALEKNDWNSPALFSWNLAGGANPGNAPGPPFFRPAGRPVPAHVHADLVALTLRERGGKPFASYGRKSAYGELEIPPAVAEAPPEQQPGNGGEARPPGKKKFPLIKPKSRSRLKEMKDTKGAE